MLEILVCPACLPGEYPLDTAITRQDGNDIMEGKLSCPACGRTYPVGNGVACILPNDQATRTSGSKYELSPVVASYLWSHYSDLMGDPEATTAYAEWAALMAPDGGFCLDMGGAVGRFTFEMGRKFDYAVGIDNSEAFVKTAREIMQSSGKIFDLPEEGMITKSRQLAIPPEWNMENVEFIVADAMHPPFAAGTFAAAASLNMVDKLPRPMLHLQAANRLVRAGKGQFLLSDPFSWSTESAPPENWLGGNPEGPFAGSGLDNITALLGEENGELKPLWQIDARGHVWWKIRTHRNHFELIRSCYVKAFR